MRNKDAFVIGFVTAYIFLCGVFLFYNWYMQSTYLGWYNPYTERFCINTYNNPDIDYTIRHEYAHYEFDKFDDEHKQFFCDVYNETNYKKCSEEYARSMR